MSATNRSIQEQKNNYYATPSWAVNKLLPHLNADEKSWMLVPGCGDGAIVSCISDAIDPALVVGIENDASLL